MEGRPVGALMAKAAQRMIDPDDSVLLMIDHQSGLLQLVRDVDVAVLRSHATALAKVARVAGIPTFTTASVPDGPNGPLIPEIHQANPEAVYIPRTGQINAWDNPAWVEAIEGTGRKTLLMAGVLTSVCVVFPALSAIERGYKVFTIIDGSGNWSRMATDVSIARLAQCGVVPIDTYAVLCEIMGTWNRADAMEFAQIMSEHVVPAYQGLTESYEKAQDVQRRGRETKLDQLAAGGARR